ncbi:MAG: urease accessory protein UreF [Pseudomonadota bacterium]
MTLDLQKLFSWLSPGYPVGAFTYSHGMEWAIADGRVQNASTARAWIADCLEHGAGRSDAILLVAAHRAVTAADAAALTEISDLAFALAPSAERLLETDAQGQAFSEVTGAVWGSDQSSALPYAVALGAEAARHGIAVEPTVEMFLHAYVANLISACVRLVPMGQTDGQKVLAELMPQVRSVADDAQSSDLDDLGGCTILADIASMKHETQDVRLFRS